jgi:tetratricopeptide (TPR) repeat protein
LGKRNSNAETIEQAIGAFNRALEVQTPGEQPYDWAASQLMLGNALFSLALLDKGTESIERSIVTLRKALTKFTKEEAPRDWGSAKCGLGAAFALLGMRSQKADSLKNAIGEYEEALDALEPFFFEWAQAQEKRGEALLELAIMEPDAHPLEKATNALNLAIPELAGRDPDRWASAEYNLGRAHLRLGEQRHPQVLDFNFAETAFRRALSVWTSGPKHDMAIAALANVHRHLKALGHRNT